MNNDDFDELPALRRAYAKIEQRNGELGEKIGVLKQERARLWYALDCLLAGETELAKENARLTLEQVRIDQ